MKNFPLADSSELISVRLISVFWAQKRLIPTFVTWCTSSSWKIFFSPIPASWWLLDSFRPAEAKNVWFLLSRHDVRRVHEKFSSCRFERAHDCSTHFGLLSAKTFHCYFRDMMYVQFMKNFLLADSSELMAVRLIPASRAQKRLIPTFLTWCTSSSWKIFFSPIPASWWLLDSFRPPEANNVWFLLSRYDVRRVHEKFSSCRFVRAHGCSTHFSVLSAKTFDSYFRDMMYVQFMKNFLLADSCELMAVRLISASWAQKRLIPTFLTWCTSSSWKIFFSPIPASWWLLDSFRPPEDKNVWFLLSRHDVGWVHEKFSSCRFDRAHGC